MFHECWLKIYSSMSLLYNGLASLGLKSLVVCEVIMKIAVKNYGKLPRQNSLLQISSFLVLKSATLGLKHLHKRYSINFLELILLRGLLFHIW